MNYIRESTVNCDCDFITSSTVYRVKELHCKCKCVEYWGLHLCFIVIWIWYDNFIYWIYFTCTHVHLHHTLTRIDWLIWGPLKTYWIATVSLSVRDVERKSRPTQNQPWDWPQRINM